MIEGEAKAGFKVFGLNIDARASAGIGLSAIAKVGVTSEIKIRTGWNRAIRWFVGRIGFGIITKIDWKL
ncbi:hypothetical protein B8V60_05255 [Streptococcus agalactiae]|nr:hypothetical protein B8V09_02555 [Streptococcus agalactiae]KAF1126908.1 hypothetical protein B8U92_05170 [Streptococcus agalactiae]KAF1138014.1 hypothetical protein B8V14_08625 [Streptococcus agalactiae]KAF1144768.1 hypothetical protein B8V13_05995 [Streptococcus agalactiae]KAF1145609.1 hypothetical protein B8V16_07900 [Streptococcus agalactiae]